MFGPKIPESFNELFEDEISAVTFNDPYILITGQTLDMDTIQQIMGKDKKNPFTRGILTENSYLPNNVVLQLINYLNEKKGEIEKNNGMLTEIPLAILNTEGTLFKDPVVAVDGETYERAWLENYLKENNNITPKGVEQKLPLASNLLLKKFIEQVKSQPNFDNLKPQSKPTEMIIKTISPKEQMIEEIDKEISKIGKKGTVAESKVIAVLEDLRKFINLNADKPSLSNKKNLINNWVKEYHRKNDENPIKILQTYEVQQKYTFKERIQNKISIPFFKKPFEKVKPLELLQKIYGLTDILTSNQFISALKTDMSSENKSQESKLVQTPKTFIYSDTKISPITDHQNMIYTYNHRDVNMFQLTRNENLAIVLTFDRSNKESYNYLTQFLLHEKELIKNKHVIIMEYQSDPGKNEVGEGLGNKLASDNKLGYYNAGLTKENQLTSQSKYALNQYRQALKKEEDFLPSFDREFKFSKEDMHQKSLPTF